MLIVFLYHRIGSGKYANSPETLRSHLVALKKRYPIVLPGDPLAKGKLSVCLTFDDASYDFYHYAYPLLKELDLRAVLGVPAHYILDKSDLSPRERLSIPYPLAMQEGVFDTKAPFCTWQELKEMVTSGHVEVASHSWLHCNLTFPFVDLQREVVASKQLIEERLPQAVTSFIYPFGKTSQVLDKFVRAHYAYTFRIGSTLNRNWHPRGPLCRVSADQMRSPYAPFSRWNLLKYSLKRTLHLLAPPGS